MQLVAKARAAFQHLNEGSGAGVEAVSQSISTKLFQADQEKAWQFVLLWNVSAVLHCHQSALSSRWKLCRRRS